MSKHIKRSGGKFGGSHTTFIPVAAIAADIAASCDVVTNIASGIISIPRGKSGSRRNVKIIDVDSGVLLLVTDGAAHQDVRVYTSDVHTAKFFIAQGVRNEGLSISFGDRRTKKPCLDCGGSGGHMYDAAHCDLFLDCEPCHGNGKI